jgi:nucleotide-binding universal stress UspA family protein
MKNVVLALDVENFDEGLLGFALDLCICFGAKLWVIHVAPYPSTFIGYEDGPEYIRVSVAEDLRKEHRFLQKLAKQVSAKNVDAQALLISGEIVESLMGQVEKIGADLVLTGVHKHGFLANALGGNTALEIIKRSKVPVITYPL